MKLIVALAVVAVAAVSAFPPQSAHSVAGGPFQGFSGFGTQQRAVTIQPHAYSAYQAQPVSHPQPIAILKSESDQGPDGSYHYAYETENGIAAQEQGQQKQIGNEFGTVAQGGFEYTAPDGQRIVVRYTADENGFQPEGNALPVAPPVPEAILRALQYNAAHPEEDNL